MHQCQYKSRVFGALNFGQFAEARRKLDVNATSQRPHLGAGTEVLSGCMDSIFVLSRRDELFWIMVIILW